MARKSIFDIAAESLDISNETTRIYTMFEEENSLYLNMKGYSLREYVDSYIFEDWKWRGHFLNVDDFLESIRYDDIVKFSEVCHLESFLLLIELVYNFWKLSHIELTKDGSELKWGGNFYHLNTVMEDNLQKFNHKAYFCDERILVIEDKPEVTAVVEIVDRILAIDVIRYNHRSLKGELEAKKKILLALGAEIEPKRKDLQSRNKQLSEDIFFMLNSINIRHNNCNEKDPSKYKEYVAQMTNEQLEEWYDELYQMILLAILLLDNIDRTTKVKELKEKIIGESN